MKSKKHIKLNVSCPVCDSQDYKIFLLPWIDENNPVKLYGAASGVRGTQTLVRCSSCQMIYENPRYGEEVIINGYKKSNVSGHDSQYPMRVKSFYKTLLKHAKFLPSAGARILDIGTAGGAFLDAATQFGYNAYGMEPSEHLVELGKARGLQIEQGTIDSHKFELGSFDLICMWDVIEHLVNPKAALFKIYKLLKSEGILLINYPDIGTLQAKLAGRRFWWILSVHLHHFTGKTIKDICDRTGFKAFSQKRYWQILEFGYLEDMAGHLGMPMAKTIVKLTPSFIRRIPIPYYASQTTILAKAVLPK